MINIEENETDTGIVTGHKTQLANAFRYILNSIDNSNWYIVGTLTWKRENRRIDTEISQSYRVGDFNRFLIAFCNQFNFRKKNLLYYRGTEFGGGEAHVNFSIAKQGLEHIPANTISLFMEYLWIHDLYAFDSKTRGIGMAKIRPYDIERADRWENYITKVEFDDNYSPRESYPFLSTKLQRLIMSKDNTKPDYSLN